MEFAIAGMNFPTLTCVMMFYSFIGWVYESTIFSLIEQGKFMNRGCFIGPYLPIYSVVGVLNLYLLSDISSPVKIVLIAALTCCAVEYITSWGLEKIFHARYWDYSYFPLNINGRISVVSGAFFGFAILFLVKVLHPFVMIFMNKISDKNMFYACIACWSVFLLDAIFTVIGMCNLNRKCKEIYDALDASIEKSFDKINSKKKYFNKFRIVKKGKSLIVKVKGINKKFVELETKYLRVYPAFRSTIYGELLGKMKEALQRKNAASDAEDIEDEAFESEEIPEVLPEEVLEEAGDGA